MVKNEFGDTLKHKKTILFLIEALKRESDQVKYVQKFFPAGVITVVTICIGAFLSGFSNFPSSFDEFIDIYSQIFKLAFWVIFLICIVYYIIYEIQRNMKKSKFRLIRILENIYLELDHK